MTTIIHTNPPAIAAPPAYRNSVTSFMYKCNSGVASHYDHTYIYNLIMTTLGPTNLGHNKFGYYNFGHHQFSHKLHVRDVNMLVIYDFL